MAESDVRQAFQEARAGRPVVLAFTNHDFRDMRPDVDAVRNMLSRVAVDFPDVSFKFSEAVDAMRKALGLVSRAAVRPRYVPQGDRRLDTCSGSALGNSNLRTAAVVGAENFRRNLSITTTSTSMFLFTGGSTFSMKKHFL